MKILISFTNQIEPRLYHSNVIVIGNNMGEIIPEHYLNKNLNIDNTPPPFPESLPTGLTIRFEPAGV